MKDFIVQTEKQWKINCEMLRHSWNMYLNAYCCCTCKVVISRSFNRGIMFQVWMFYLLNFLQHASGQYFDSLEASHEMRVINDPEIRVADIVEPGCPKIYNLRNISISKVLFINKISTKIYTKSAHNVMYFSRYMDTGIYHT